MSKQSKQSQPKRKKKWIEVDDYDTAYAYYLVDLVKQLKVSKGLFDRSQFVMPSENYVKKLVENFENNGAIKLREGRLVLRTIEPPDSAAGNLLGKGIFPEEVEEAARLAGISHWSIIGNDDGEPMGSMIAPVPLRQLNLEWDLEKYYHRNNYQPSKEKIRADAAALLRGEELPPIPGTTIPVRLVDRDEDESPE